MKLLGIFQSIVFLSLVLGTSNSEASKVKSAEAIAQDLRMEQQKIESQEESRRNVLADLFLINNQLKSLNSERSKIEKNLGKASENVAALTVLIQQMNDRVGQQRMRLRERLKALSKIQGQGYVRMLFSSQSSAERNINMRVLKRITEKEFRMIKSHRENLQVLQAQQEKLAQQESRYLTLKKKLDEKERALAGQIAKKNGVLKTIDSERMLRATRLKRLRISSQRSPDLQEEIRKIEAIEELFQEQIFERKGRLRSPVEGRVVLDYGWLPDEELGTKIRFKGNLIGAKPLMPVNAVFKGKVVLSESLEGYGPTIVVDHGGHYYSVYGNLSDLEVRAGQRVEEGQRIGLTSERHAFFGQGLYFELRHFSDPENPRLWIAANETIPTDKVRRKGRQ